jgi:hypothetical protein
MSTRLFSGGKEFGNGFIDAELNDAELIDYVSAYRRRVAGNYRPLLLDDFGNLPANGLLVSTKIDGELWFLVSSLKSIFLVNTKGQVIHGNIPVLADAKKLPENTIIAGELYAKVDGRRSRVGDLSALLTYRNESDIKNLSFAAFDLLRSSGVSVDTHYADRYAELNELITSSGSLSVAKSEEIDRNRLMTRFESEVIKGQAEGLIVRLPSGLIYKLKPTITIDAAVVAYTTKSQESVMARSILLALMRQDGKFQIIGGCGNLGSDSDRVSLAEKLEKLKVNTPIRYASDSGNLYTFVKPEIVVEVKVTDFQLERSDGNNSATMNLIYKDKLWHLGSLSSCPRPIHPVLVRVRTDKKVNQDDTRISQIADFMGTDDDTKANREIAKSNVVRREVWTKQTKGVVAVRKLLVWKTNKDSLNSNFPAFVIHWTDYSPGRASPLDREVKVAPTIELAFNIADQLVDTNIKKGWEKV